MANRIQIKRSLTSGNVPNATDLLVGEFAVNIPDKKIFTKNGADQVVKLNVTDYSELTGTPTLGTAAAKDVPTTGDAATTEVVLGSDTRLTDARTPLSHSHANATTTSSGFISVDDQLKLNGIEAGANAYAHPTGDGNLHVPATGTTSAGKVLTAGAEAGSLSWETPSATDSTKLPLSGGTMSGTIEFAGNQVWPTFNQPTTGNADTSTKLATARTINGVSFDGSADITINAVDSTARIASSEKGAANGVATLGADGKVPAAQLPSYVDDVLEFTNLAGFPATGGTSVIYVALDTNKIYRWSGSTYVEISVGGGTSNPNPETLTYTYTGVLDVPITSLPGTAEMVVASPLGKERAYGILLSSANVRLTGVEFPNLEFIGSSFNPSSMGALTSLSLPALTAVGGSFAPINMQALTSLSLPALTTVGSNFNPSSMGALTSLSLPALTTVGSNFNPNGMAALTSLSLPALTTVGGQFIPGNMAALTSLSLPALTTVGGQFSPFIMAALTSLSLPAMTTVGGQFNPNGMAALTSLSLPALTAVGGSFAPINMQALTSLSLPAVEVIGATLTSGNAIQLNNSTSALTSFTLPTTLKQLGGSAGNVMITSAALNQASVDNILERLAALDGTNGTVEFKNRTVTITGTSSTPSAAGLAAKATLVARGCTVTHN